MGGMKTLYLYFRGKKSSMAIFFFILGLFLSFRGLTIQGVSRLPMEIHSVEYSRVRMRRVTRSVLLITGSVLLVLSLVILLTGLSIMG